MGIFNKNNGGLMDEIRCDEQDYLIWKWHPKGSTQGANTRENAIRLGSSLRVRDGAVAVFVYKQKDGTIQDYIEGPYDQILSTENIPVIASVIGLAYDGGTPFQAEVYFINLAEVIQIQFGVPFFDVYDPRFMDFGVPTAVRGVVTFKISDYKQFIKLHRLDNFNLEDFKRQVKEAIVRYVKSVVANIPFDYNIPLVQIERRISEVNDLVLPQIQQRLKEDFGVEVSGVDVSTIEVDKTSEGYQQLKAVTLDVQTQTTQAQAQVNIKNLEDQQRINSENMEETLRIQREEAQYAQRKQTQSANFPAFQLETQAAVGIAGAEALGQMGANGAMDMGGGVGGDGGVMNPAAMMAGMAMGGAIGQNMAGMMNGMMNGVEQSTPSQTPPPVPTTEYHVVINGQASDAFNMATLTQMASSGLLNQDSLVWKAGMPEWKKASEVAELQALFTNRMPPIPGA